MQEVSLYASVTSDHKLTDSKDKFKLLELLTQKSINKLYRKLLVQRITKDNKCRKLIITIRYF